LVRLPRVPFSTTTLSWLVLLALLLALIALLLAAATWRKSARVGGSQQARRPATSTAPAQVGAGDVAAELDLLRAAVQSSLRHLAVVRYDAFGDMGGHLSWSMALLDDAGDGVVVTSIHGRSDSRTYAKNVSSWTANQQLSPEEEEAISFARNAVA
jgi:Protein of unknown function (DUF4446)